MLYSTLLNLEAELPLRTVEEEERKARAWAEGAKVEDVVRQALQQAKTELSAQLKAIRGVLADAQLPSLRQAREGFVLHFAAQNRHRDILKAVFGLVL